MAVVHAASVAPAEQRVVLHDIPWELYEQILARHESSSAPRFTYDRGELEIMSPRSVHERLNRCVQLFVSELAVELDIDIASLGSTTFKRKDIRRGFEPDSCFYREHAQRMRGQDDIDLGVDPPPELVVEIDISHSSVPKLPILAEIGVPEVWRFDGTAWHILHLEGGAYVEGNASLMLPAVTADALTEQLALGSEMSERAWIRRVREWARSVR
jgi:Uma2 family endonuclease